MMWLYPRSVMFFENAAILEDFALKTDFKVDAETCSLIVFSSLGCVEILPMVLSNFLEGFSNHENTSKQMHT